MTITAYPLTWPAGWKRTQGADQRPAKFGKAERVHYEGGGGYTRTKPLTVADAVDRVLVSLTRMGIPRDDIVISTNLELRTDGLPRSQQRAPRDPGAAVYWRDGGADRCLAVDHYTTVEDNLAAIAATLEALRAIERHGSAQILDRAFAGFTALPAPGQTTARGWREILGVDANERDLVKVEQRYRKLASIQHPDKGGTDAAMAEINGAWQQAQEALRG